jgi:PleD family two-component response regulator
MLREMVRTLDRVVHYQEAEYLVILPETPLDGARIVAHRLAYAAKERLESEIRVGIAEFPTNGQTAEELIAEADAALTFARGADLSVVGSE